MSTEINVNGVIYEVIEIGSGTKYAMVKNVLIPGQYPTTHVQLEAFIGDAPVVEIKSEAFMDATFLKTIKIPSTLTRIAPWAFDGCNNLEIVEIAEGQPKIEVGNNAFSRCNSLKSIIFDEFFLLEGNGVFKDCNELTDIPCVLRTLPNMTFYNCQKLTRVHICGKISINNRVFVGSGVKELICHGELDYVAKAAEKEESFTNITIVTDIVTPVLEELVVSGQSVQICER